MNVRDPREARGLAAYKDKQRSESGPLRQALGLGLALVALVGAFLVGGAVWRTWHERADQGAVAASAAQAGAASDTGSVAGRLQAILGAGGDADAPGGIDATPVRFEIKSGETAAAVAQKLQNQALIKDADSFRVLLRVMGIDTRLEAGVYELKQTMTPREIAAALQKGRAPSVTVTIPEGWRAEEIAALMASQGLVDQDEFMRLVKSGEGFKQPFLPQQGTASGLEGYLFPDTYTFDTTASDARTVINRLLDNFGAKVGADLQQAAAAAKLGSLQNAVTLAAIVEREARIAEERPLIASAYSNRLNIGMKLDADPTVQYGMGYDKDRKTWWRPLTPEDYKFQSPYNTYLNPGLPPGPIANPGLASIKAALSPTQSDYLYFVAKKDGAHLFAKDFEEHVRNVNSVK